VLEGEKRKQENQNEDESGVGCNREINAEAVCRCGAERKRLGNRAWDGAGGGWRTSGGADR